MFVNSCIKLGVAQATTHLLLSKLNINYNGIVRQNICCVVIQYITQRRGPSKYNNQLLRAQFEYEFACATFRASNYYIKMTHGTRMIEHKYCYALSGHQFILFKWYTDRACSKNWRQKNDLRKKIYLVYQGW